MPELKFEEIFNPPINSLTYSFDFNSAIIVPTRRSPLKAPAEVSLMIAYERSKTKDTNIWSKSSVKKHLYQLLNKPEVEGLIKHRTANGHNNISTFIIMYLKAKLMINVKEDMESIPDRIPSREKTFKFPLEYAENISTKLENDISMLFPNIFFPSEHINVVISEVASII